MKTPVIAYQDHAERSGIPPAVASDHLEYMKKVMLFPPEQEAQYPENPSQPATRLVNIDIFAHGPEVLRIAKAVPFAQYAAEQEWLVQSLSIQDNSFITQKAYSFDPANEKAAQEAYTAAYADAKDWYPAPDKSAYIKKWDALIGIHFGDSDEAVSPNLNSREKLAEFWYESKAIDWTQDTQPFFYEYSVAQYLLSANAFQRDPGWNDDEYEEIQTYAMNMLESWGGDELKNTLAGKNSVPIVLNDFRDNAVTLEFRINRNVMILEISNAETSERNLTTSLLPIDFPAIADVRSIDEDDKVRIFKALNVTQETGSRIEDGNTKIITYKDESEGYFIAHTDHTYTISLGDKSYFIDHNTRLADDKFKTQDINFANEYIISVYGVKYSPDEDSGEPDSREELVVSESYNSDDLDGLSRRYESLVPSANSPNETYLWFRSSSPVEDREYFETGIETFYEVHVLEINGQPPSPAGLQRFANEMGITFSQPTALPKSDFSDANSEKQCKGDATEQYE